MKLLVLNRRDIANPLGGGAEVYTHELCKALADTGADVTYFTSRFRGATREERVDGVRYLRCGNELTVHAHGFLHAWKNRQHYDLVVDEYNGLGFFGFLLPRCMILIHQLYGQFWFRELGALGLLPYLLEPLLVRAYRRRPAMTLSESTRDDLFEFGFRDVRIVMVGLAPRPEVDDHAKEDDPTLVFLGRLRSTKRPEDALTILERVQSELPRTKLWMIGRGPEEDKLQRRAQQLRNVEFHGWVDEERKYELLSRAHLLLVPGVREGFGINVIEAAHEGTPAIGYRVHGLRDSIRDGRTGVLVDGPEEAAAAALQLLRDPARYQEMVEASRAYARTFKWSERAVEFREGIAHAIAHYDAQGKRGREGA